MNTPNSTKHMFPATALIRNTHRDTTAGLCTLIYDKFFWQDALTYIILGGASGIIIITLIIALIISVKLGSAQRRQIEVGSCSILMDGVFLQISLL